MKKIFIDSDSLLALHDEYDKFHKKAFLLFDKLPESSSIYTSVNVLLEVLTLVSQRVEKSHAIRLLQEFRSGKYIVINPDEKLIFQAEELFIGIRSKNVSYSDCVSFAIMNSYGIQTVFSFDKHFKKQGFKRFGIDK